ncbi:hypothetical protein EDC01DRAFT_28733 [Geopyxis carbonaria]|nr:hypothetical protein EDC01DRAFT_28733 [Geopyxis carbonaria]
MSVSLATLFVTWVLIELFHTERRDIAIYTYIAHHYDPKTHSASGLHPPPDGTHPLQVATLIPPPATSYGAPAAHLICDFIRETCAKWGLHETKRWESVCGGVRLWLARQRGLRTAECCPVPISQVR